MNYHLIILFIQFFLVTLKGHDNEVKNIMLIGRTGSGKSTLANVFVNKNNELEEVFEEYPGSIRGTKDTQNEIFEVNYGSKKVKYRIIDTVGFGDTKITTKEVLEKIAKTIPFIEEGLHGIFFVINGRFTKEEIQAYHLLKETIFDNEVVKYTTIISPRFPDFQNETACKEDCFKIENENPELADIIKSARIIHVNTPPLKGSPNMVESNKEARKASRQKLIAHLNNCQGIYHPSNLDTFEERVWNYLSDEEKMKRKLEKEERRREEEERRREEAERQREEEERRREEAERQKEEADRQKEEADRQKEEADRRREEADRRREEADRELDWQRRLNDELKKKRESGSSSIDESIFSILGTVAGGLVGGPIGAIVGAVAGAGLGQQL